MKWTLAILAILAGHAAAEELARPPKEALLAYSGPLWQAWRYPDRKRASLLIVRLHTGKLAREVVIPRRHAFQLVLGDGTVVTAPTDRRYVTLLDPDGKRTDHAPYIWKKACRLIAAYRDGIVVQTEQKGTGHLFFVPWRRGVLQQDKRIRLTREEQIVEPPPKLQRHGATLRLDDIAFDLVTRERRTIENAPSSPSLYDGKLFVDARLGFLMRDGIVYAVHRKPDAVHLIARAPKDTRPRQLADFRIPEGDTGEILRGRDCVSFKPKLRGARHVRWDKDGLWTWNGMAWKRAEWVKRAAR